VQDSGGNDSQTEGATAHLQVCVVAILLSMVWPRGMLPLFMWSRNNNQTRIVISSYNCMPKLVGSQPHMGCCRQHQPMIFFCS
jgi:hypothetical protein